MHFKQHGRKRIAVMILFLIQNVGFYITGFRLFPRVLEGLERSGRLVGSISTYTLLDE